MLYKGYIETKGKQSIEKLKGRTNWKKLEEVQNCKSYGGILADDTVLVDIDGSVQAELLLNIIEQKQIKAKVVQTGRGKHFLFKNHTLTRNRTHVQLAIGITADIKCGSKLSYEVLKVDGVERPVEYDTGEEYDEIPKWLTPVASSMDFLDMEAGDGRNQTLFNYILTLQANGFTVEECRECIRLMNQFVLKEPLPDSELDTILRDEAFQKPVFFMGSTFLFDKFAMYLRDNEHVIKINNQLHIYRDGVYIQGYKEIESTMISLIPNLRKSQRREVLDYMELIAEEKPVADANLIAFNNGIYDIFTDELKPFSSDIVITNKIPWDYVPDAYNELADSTLDKLSCNDDSIRSLLEECIGYCLYRRNELGKAFILIGDKANGKSTFLDCVKAMLGEDNISALDLKELGDRFSTSMMFGKLANIGDDIGDDFLQGSQVSIFKKIVTGNRIKAERKGQDPFEFNPFIKLLFSANDMPRMKDKTGAVLRRLVIIPFNHIFDKTDPEYDPFIKYKLIRRESVEYLIRLGIAGLKRVLANDEFTHSTQVDEEIAAYEEENNPIVGFIADSGIDLIENEPTADVYKRYQVYCADNAMTPMSNIVFSKQINKRLGMETVQKKVGGINRRIFVRSRGNWGM